MMIHPPKSLKLPFRPHYLILPAVLLLALGAAVSLSMGKRGGVEPRAALKSQAMDEHGRFHPTASQWAMLTVEPVEMHKFRTEFVTEGKVALDEDRVTRIFSPFAGRVTKILAAPGDAVQQGEPLFIVEAADSLQAQNDFIAAEAALNKARSQVNLTQIIEQRLGALYKDRVTPLKNWQEAQANLTTAENDLRSDQIGLEAVRNRLRLLGKTDAEIETFEKTGAITPDAEVRAPLSGTILQRKVGPNQYVNAGASEGDPVFLIGDISKLWLIVSVHESDASQVKLGEPIRFTVLAYPDRVFEAKINYVATSIDPHSRRLMVRANIDNSEGLLKPEMFASVAVVSEEGAPTPAVPREAVIYEGDATRVWVATGDQAVELRQIKLGLTGGRLVQVIEGLAPGEKIVTRGTLFIDRIAGSNQS